MQVLLINYVLKYVKMSVFAVFEWQSENFVVSLRDIFTIYRTLLSKTNDIRRTSQG